MFVVDFVVGTKYLAVCVFELLDLGEKLYERFLHEPIAIAHHGVGFAGASLAVNKDAAIIAIESACD